MIPAYPELKNFAENVIYFIFEHFDINYTYIQNFDLN